MIIGSPLSTIVLNHRDGQGIYGIQFSVMHHHQNGNHGSEVLNLATSVLSDGLPGMKPQLALGHGVYL